MKAIKELFVLSFILSVLWGCASSAVKVTPEAPAEKPPEKMYESEIDPETFKNWDEVASEMIGGNTAIYICARRTGDIRIAYIIIMFDMSGAVWMTEYGYLKNGKLLSYMADEKTGVYMAYQYDRESVEFMTDFLKESLAEYMKNKM